MLIPIIRYPTNEELTKIHHQTFQIVPLHQPSSIQKTLGPFEKMSEILSQDPLFTPSILTHLPKKWDRIGHILIIKKLHLEFFYTLENSHFFETKIASTLLQVVGNGAKAVIVDEQGVQGELRTPSSVRILVGESLETVHVENGIQYEIDVGKIMFSSGNGTERIHFARNVKLSDKEMVVDMFTGIGIF
jgi:tRNA G37 N-methylase Trm5